MKLFVTCSVALLITAPCMAQTTRYDPTSGLVDIPCVELYRNAAPVLDDEGEAKRYHAQLQHLGNFQFQLISAVLIDEAPDCLARYDSLTGVYTDDVSLADNSYQISMNLHPDFTSGLIFGLYSAVLTGPAKTSLWVVSDGTSEFFLGGTVHALRPGDFPLPRAFEEAYAQATRIYFELDLDDPIQSGIGLPAVQMNNLVRDPQGKLLHEVLSPDIYNDLVAYLTALNVPVANVEHWSAQMLMNAYPTEHAKHLIGATAGSVDMYFANKAQTDNKPVEGLETFESQVIMLHTVNEGIEDEMVRRTLDDIASGKAGTDLLELILAWRYGDTTSIQQTVAEVREENRRDYDLVLTDRNNAWLPRLEALLDSPEIEMVLVGASHVSGPEGLVKLLKDRGYSVTKY